MKIYKIRISTTIYAKDEKDLEMQLNKGVFISSPEYDILKSGDE